jgi:peptidoglycan/LPS O-acetylase OafA/YrhL
LVEQVIGESFVGAFRVVMGIGAALAILSAIVAWFLISTPAQRKSSRSTKAFPD